MSRNRSLFKRRARGNLPGVERRSAIQPDRVYAADWRNLGHSCSCDAGTSSACAGIALPFWRFLYAACNPAGMNKDATAPRITKLPLISPIGCP